MSLSRRSRRQRARCVGLHSRREATYRGCHCFPTVTPAACAPRDGPACAVSVIGPRPMVELLVYVNIKPYYRPCAAPSGFEDSRRVSPAARERNRSFPRFYRFQQYNRRQCAYPADLSRGIHSAMRHYVLLIIRTVSSVRARVLYF